MNSLKIKPTCLDVDSFEHVLDLLPSILESEIQLKSINGGLLNTFNNDKNSVYKIQTNNSSLVLKVKNTNENIESYFTSAFVTNKISNEKYKELIHGFGFLPGFKEVKLYEYFSNFDKEFILECHFIGINEDLNNSYILMEDISNNLFFDFLVEKPISIKHVETAILTVSDFHNFIFENNEYKNWGLINEFSKQFIIENKTYFETVFEGVHSIINFEPPKKIVQFLQNAYSNLLEVFDTIDSGAKILTHNDFNIRNTCFVCEDNNLSFKIFDWDLSIIQNPEFDAVEYIMFLFKPLQLDEFKYILETYYNNSIIVHDKLQFFKRIKANILWFMAYKWCVYSVMTGIDMGFLKRLSINANIYLDLIDEIINEY